MKKLFIFILLFSFANISFAEEYKCDYTDKELNTNLYRLLENKKVDNKNATGVICFTKDEGQMRFKLEKGKLLSPIEIINYDANKRPVMKVYASDYNIFFKYNNTGANPLQNKQAFKEIINNIDFTQVLFNPENNNKILEIVIKDKKGTATFYYEDNITNYVIPITENGYSNKSKYYDENGNFLAEVISDNGSIAEVKCAGGKIIKPDNMHNISHIQYLCK